MRSGRHVLLLGKPKLDSLGSCSTDNQFSAILQGFHPVAKPLAVWLLESDNLISSTVHLRGIGSTLENNLGRYFSIWLYFMPILKVMCSAGKKRFNPVPIHYST